MVASSAVGEAAPRTTVRISDIVVVGDVQYIEEHNKFGLPCCSWSSWSPGKSKKRRMPASPVAAEKQFSVESPSASRTVLQLKLLSEKVLRSRVRDEDEVVAIVPMPRLSTGDLNNNLIVNMYRLLAFEN